MGSRRRIDLEHAVIPLQTSPKVFDEIHLNNIDLIVYQDTAGVKTLMDMQQSPYPFVSTFWVQFINRPHALGACIFNKLVTTFGDHELCNILTDQILRLIFSNPSSLDQYMSFSIIALANIVSTHMIEDTSFGYQHLFLTG